MFFITAFVLAATLSGDSNQSNISYSAASPVRVATCALDPVVYYAQSGDGGIAYVNQVATNINVSFADTEQKPISSVTFAVSDGGNARQQIVDTGTFSPGARIAHVFSWPYIENGNVTCKVSSVSYSDGSTWAAPTETADATGK